MVLRADLPGDGALSIVQPRVAHVVRDMCQPSDELVDPVGTRARPPAAPRSPSPERPHPRGDREGTQTIDTYVIGQNGRASGPNVQASSGATPFGFQFGPDGRLYVSDAPASAASSYDVAADGTL
jgi:hypothetical protein